MPNVKLTEEDVRLIRELHSSAQKEYEEAKALEQEARKRKTKAYYAKNYQVIANKFGVSRAAINSIIQGHIWQHVSTETQV